MRRDILAFPQGEKPHRHGFLTTSDHRNVFYLPRNARSLVVMRIGFTTGTSEWKCLDINRIMNNGRKEDIRFS